MHIELLPARSLSSDLVARWDQIVRSAPELDSPFFRPEFTQMVAALRDRLNSESNPEAQLPSVAN